MAQEIHQLAQTFITTMVSFSSSLKNCEVTGKSLFKLSKLNSGIADRVLSKLTGSPASLSNNKINMEKTPIKISRANVLMVQLNIFFLSHGK